MSGDSLQGRSVVVVGASSGIGRGVATLAVQAGADVVLAARRADRLDEVVSTAGGGMAVVTDLRSTDDCQRLAATVAAQMSGIDLLLISAGTAPLGKMATISADDWRLVLETNLVGIHQAIAALLDHLSPQAIVAVVSSESVMVPRSHLGAYGASKAALEHTFLQWQEEHPHLRFTTISLGATVPTEFGHGFSREGIVEAIQAWAASGRAQSAFMDTDEVCQVLFDTLAALISSPSVGMPRIELRSPAPVISSGDDAVAAAASSRRH
jgi:NAD(P)-dependent dehydrogenase (short-subunit alcohol dehydrogenase family)